jgi:tubulin---tyrosine ligase
MRIINHLWDNWGGDPLGLRTSAHTGEKEVDLYSINVPMIPELLAEQDLPICWTDMWRKSYGQLFKAHTHNPGASRPPGGPDEPGAESPSPAAGTDAAQHDVGRLVFKWGPEIKGLITPNASSVPVGSDAWAINNGYVSVTPLRAGFAEPDKEEAIEEARFWKVKL